MADSLFDNRYRYDYIYPRGRSGETLRAIDTAVNDRKVVIKRPALNDAPPIRAGQEVSIANERRVLQRLAGHPVLTELLDEGRFFVGGTPHQYIVLERAEGTMIGDEVLGLDTAGERLPELEMLVIVDRLLDLLYTAHAKDIVYNDVDAKHLFWNRDTYSLKAIDWGNAIFLEGDEVTPQGISRQTDIFQVGELLFFIVTGGRRADIPRHADEDFKLDFGDDSRRIHSQLQEIVSKAVHPNSRFRYPNIMALRNDLNNYRNPLERERNASVVTVADKLKRNDLTMSELRTLRTVIDPVLKRDPGYPPAREAHNTIIDRLRDLSVEADLDAVQIYMQNSNWSRAADVLRELQDKAGTKTGGLINLLLDICVILIDNNIHNISPTIGKALQELFEGKNSAAALVLLDDADDEQRSLQWHIAERISSHMPEVLLLRPNLYRISNALRQIAMDGYIADEPRNLLAYVEKTLDDIVNGSLNLAFLRDSYRSVVDQLSTLNPILQTFAAQHELSTRRVPINALERALNAAMALADSMHVIGKQAASSPHEARKALETSRSIDPVNPIWLDLDELLNRLYDRLQTSQTYVPAADGSDLQDWLEATHDKLRPFQERLFDELLAEMSQGTENALRSWKAYQEIILQGNREQAVTSLEKASESVRTISPALSQWFSQLRTVVAGANYVERHALPGGLGRALADGWAAFDRGRLADSERLGQQAFEIARTETGRSVATRLQDLSRLTREWVERNGVASASRTKALLTVIEKLFTEEEIQIRQNFEKQMPSIDTYLKAMSRGLITHFENSNTAALRILFIYYIAQGTLDVHEHLLDDGEFWREAAIKTLSETGERHIATRTLGEYITHRRDLIVAAELFAQINGKQILPELANMRRRLEDNAQSRLLASGIQSLRDLEIALRHWSDGDFRAAGLKLEETVKGVRELEQAADLNLEAYKAWLMELLEAAAYLTVQAREMRVVIDQRPDAPEAKVRKAFHEQVAVTERMLGTSYLATLRQWLDTYNSFVEVFNSDERRSKRLERLNELFRAMFIDQHPTYPLYRHWYTVLEAQSEFAAPRTHDPTPREEISDIPEFIYRDGHISPDVVVPIRRAGIPRGLIIVAIAIVAVLIVGLIGLNILNSSTPPEIALTISPTPHESTQTAIAAVVLEESTAIITVTSVPAATHTEIPSPSKISPSPTVLPTETYTPTLTQTPSPTPTVPTHTPTATDTASITPTTPPPTATPLPEGGLRGRQDLLALFNRTLNLPFNPDIFFPIDGAYRLGTGEETSDDIIRIAPPLDFIEESFGNNAASRMTSVEVDLSLPTFNPNLLNDEAGVFFGLIFESTSDGNNVGVQINVLNSTTIEIAEVQNNAIRPLRTRSVGTIVLRLRIERDLESGNVLLFLNDEQLQPSIPFLEPDAAIIPILYVRDGGVIVFVNDWRVSLR
jgi:serine/threonine protein kinase